MKKFGPCEILKRFDIGNAYEVEFPEDMDISPIFNIAYIFEYFESLDETEDNINFPKKDKDNIVKIMNSRIRKTTRAKDYMEYLVQWKDKPVEDSSWITKAELDLYDLGQSMSSS